MGHENSELFRTDPDIAERLALASTDKKRFIAAEVTEYVMRATSAGEIPTAQAALIALREQRYGDETMLERLEKLANEARAASVTADDAGTGMRMAEVHHALCTLQAALDADPDEAVFESVYESFGTDGMTAKNIKARVWELIDDIAS